MPKRIIVGVTGTSCIILVIKALETLKKAGVETHLVMTETAKEVITKQTDCTVEEIERLASKVHEIHDFFAPIASGSFVTDGMIIIPCSMKTLAGIANGNSTNLLLRAADVMLKERRKLILVTRETPLNLIHIRNMEKATLAGAVILPPLPSFYTKPMKENVAEHVVGKVCDQFGIDTGYKRWE